VSDSLENYSKIPVPLVL